MAVAHKEGEQKQADPGVLTGTKARQAGQTEAQLPRPELGFRWGAADWALLALWLGIMLAFFAYAVILARL